MAEEMRQGHGKHSPPAQRRVTHMAIFARRAALYTANKLVRVTKMTTTARRAALYNHELPCVPKMTKRARAIPVLRCVFSCSTSDSLKLM